MEDNNKKRGRGRPRKHAKIEKKIGIKRGRGRPRKHQIVENLVLIQEGGVKRIVSSPLVKSVDQLYLFEQVLKYLVKMQLVHHTLFRTQVDKQPIFTRLKDLDMQMMDICKAVLGKDLRE